MNLPSSLISSGECCVIYCRPILIPEISSCIFDNNFKNIKLAIVKSKLLKQLSQNYPNFLKKDLEKFTNIILKEIKKTLRRGERVELRGFGIFSTNTQKARISRNPKTGEKVHTPEKKNNSLQNGKRFV